jgi:hypothetical protein
MTHQKALELKEVVYQVSETFLCLYYVFELVFLTRITIVDQLLESNGFLPVLSLTGHELTQISEHDVLRSSLHAANFSN